MWYILSWPLYPTHRRPFHQTLDYPVARFALSLMLTPALGYSNLELLTSMIQNIFNCLLPQTAILVQIERLYLPMFNFLLKQACSFPNLVSQIVSSGFKL